MQYLFALLALIGSIGAVLVAVKSFRSGSALLLPLTLSVFAVRCTFGLAFIPFLPLERFDVAGQSLGDPAFYYATNPWLYPTQVSSHLLFLFLGAATVLLTRKKDISASGAFATYAGARLFRILWFAFACILFVRFFGFGPGIQLVLETRFSHGTPEAAVAHRLEAQQAVELGQGYYMAMLAAYIAFPMAAFFARMAQSKLSALIFFCSGFFSLLFAIQTRQKAPPILSAVTYLALLLSTSVRSSREDAKRLIVRLALVGFALAFLGTIAYVLNAGLAPLEALRSFVSRTFIVPPLIEALYFELFPVNSGYRGILESFYMPTRLVAPLTGDVSAHDVAYLATGYHYAANASFLAVAWSGAGLVGVSLVSGTLVIALGFLDAQLSALSYRAQAAIMAMALPSVNVLTAGPFIDYISAGGLLVPAFILIQLKFFRFDSHARPFSAPAATTLSI